LETTLPVPRQGWQVIGSGVGSSLDTAPERSGLAPILTEVGTHGHDGRFAPSPTGRLHLGNLRTALLAHLFARAGGGRFLIRIEDLDASRSRPEHEAGQLEDLAALGLESDESPVRQSERMELYDEAIARLDRDGALYRCWCTRAEIREAASAPHGPLPEGSYPGTCRDLSAAEIAERERGGRPPALRLDARAARIAFTDRLLGPREDVVDDLVVRRNDGAPAYNLAVAVDDDAQSIDEVVRGADLIDTTARQLHVGRRLGLRPVAHAHVPLMLGADGSRLAKRHGAVTLPDRLALGETAVQVRSALAASVGLAEPGEEPTLDELATRVDRLLVAA
jgi:glutamyl-tRNA synthetase